MPRDSRFTDPIIRFMTSADRPVTASEIHEAVEMSRQGAYFWLDSEIGRKLTVPVGVGRNGATAYVLAEDHDRYPFNFVPALSSHLRGGEPARRLNLGSTFVLTEALIEEDDVTITLTGPGSLQLSIGIPDPWDVLHPEIELTYPDGE